LGLRRIGHVVEVQDNPCIRGMLRKVAHLVKIISEDNAS
jgi:large subunit ribosomal protein L30